MSRNVATDWPAMQGVDMTTPADIQAKAEHLASLPKDAMAGAAAKVRAEHNSNIADMILGRAREIIRKRRPVAVHARRARR
ncbi:MAG: hypothetical protein RJQ08_13410 [Salinisphaeraceae bacterium]